MGETISRIVEILEVQLTATEISECNPVSSQIKIKIYTRLEVWFGGKVLL